MTDPLERDDDEFWADDPYVDEDEDDYDAYDGDIVDGEQEEFLLGMLAGDYAENGKIDLFGALDFDLLDITPDSTFPF